MGVLDEEGRFFGLLYLLAVEATQEVRGEWLVSWMWDELGTKQK